LQAVPIFTGSKSIVSGYHPARFFIFGRGKKSAHEIKNYTHKRISVGIRVVPGMPAAKKLFCPV
jgi:hypothetical protein